MSKLPQNPKGKEKIGFWLLKPESKIESLLLVISFLLLPTQLGKHFWPDFSVVSGIRIDYLSPTLFTTDIVLLLLFFTILIRRIKTFKISNLKSQISKLHLKSKILFGGLIFLFFLLNTFFALRPLLSFYGFAKLLEFGFLAIYLARTIRNQIQLQQIALLFAISAFFESLLAISQYFHQGSLNGIFYFLGERIFTGATPGIANASIGGTLVLRPYATFSHPNVLAGYLLISIVLMWNFLFGQKNRWVQVFAGLSLLVSGIALLLTFSRTAIFLWVLLAVFVLARKFFLSLKTQKAKQIVFIVVLLCFVIVSSLPLTHELFKRFSQTSFSEESVTQRSELLSASWKMIIERPLFGVGLDNFIPSLAPLPKLLPLGFYLQPVHNIFMLIAAETGLIGFGFFILLLISTALRIKKRKRRIKTTFFILLLVILLTGMADHYWLTLQQGQLLFATVFGLCWANISNNKASQ